MADQKTATVRGAYDDLPEALRSTLEAIARGEKVPGHHGYRAGPWLKLVGVVLGLAAVTASVVFVHHISLPTAHSPLRADEVWLFAVPASLGFLLLLRNLRRLVIDPGLRLSRWVFVTPSLVLRVEPGGASVLIHRLTSFEEGERGIVASQQEGAVTFFVGEQRVRIAGFESVTALRDFSDAVVAAVEHMRSRENDSEDAWLDRLDPSRAPTLPRKLAVAMALTLVAVLLGASAVAIAHLLGQAGDPSADSR